MSITQTFVIGKNNYVGLHLLCTYPMSCTLLALPVLTYLFLRNLRGSFSGHPHFTGGIKPGLVLCSHLTVPPKCFCLPEGLGWILSL